MFLISPHHMLSIFCAFIIELLLCKWKPRLNCFLNKEYRFLDNIFSQKEQEGSSSSALLAGSLFCLGNFLLVFFLINGLYTISPKWGMLVEIMLLVLALEVSSVFDRNRRMENLLKENKLGEARHLMGIGAESEQKPEKLFQTALSKVSNNTLSGIIGPLFFAFIGGAATAYLYRTLAFLYTLKDEKADHPLGVAFYGLMNLIPTLLAQVLIPLAGFAADESLKESWRRVKQKRQAEGIFSKDIPEAACAGALALSDTVSPEKIESETGEPSFVYPSESEALGTPVQRLNRLSLEVAWATICLLCIITFL